MSLYECFEGVPDFRRAQGRRLDLAFLLSVITLGYLCGHLSKRSLSTFAKSNEETLRQMFSTKHKMPSHVTIWTCLSELDEQELVKCFNTWAQGCAPLLGGTWISGDGKSLGSTVEDMHGKGQKFTSVLSLFCQQTGLTQVVEQYRHDKKSEIHVLQGMLRHLKEAGVVIVLDALHCQKKRSPKSARAETTTTFK